MKKIAIFTLLLAFGVVAGRAQESRQDISISGTGMIEPFVASSTTVEVSANRAFGGLVSYRYMLTPSSALEVNYGYSYQNQFHFKTNPNNYTVLAHTQEISGAFVQSFNYRKFNPFVEAGPGALIFSPMLNSQTTVLDTKRQTQVGFLYGAGVAYEVSPSFDIRAEYRGFITKVPNFGLSEFNTNRWYNIYVPTIGVAYHF